MSQQLYYQTQFITEIQGANHFQQYNIEILNYTSLNFARPDISEDSHTATMTAERRKLFDQLPNLNTNLHKKKSSLKDSKNINQIPIILSADHDKDADVTQSDAHVRFVLEPEKLHVDTAFHESDSKTRKHQLKQKLLRRVSAPTQGIEDFFKNIKKPNNSNFGNNKKIRDTPYIPSVHIEIDESVEDEANNNHHHHNNNNNNDNHHQNHHHHHHHDHNHDHDDNDNDNDNNQNACTASMSSSIASVSSIASHNPPSLSPCSSASSIGSSVDMLSPVKQSNFPQPYAIAKKSKSIQNENQHSFSLPDIVSSDPYGDEPWSPAAMFLSNFAISTVKQVLPDDEGQQVGEYIIGKVIGRGGFSTVKEAYTMDQNLGGTMKTVATKIVRNHPDSEDNENVQALLEREIAIWRRLDHENIVPMLSVVENHYATFVFSEYCPGGTLLDYIKKHGKGDGKGLYEDEARNIFLEVAEGVRYLHNDARLVHKDLKLDNILLNEEDTWKICDFGFTEYQNSVNGFNDILYNSIVGGSLAYCAPEQLRSPTPLKDPSVDVWSLGVILFAMVTGQLPFSDSFEPRLQHKIINGRYDESLLDDAGVSDDLKDLLKGMFKTKPSDRLTISEVLEHRWCER